jgi:hypothetical protein
VPPGDSASSPEVTRYSSVPCHPQSASIRGYTIQRVDSTRREKDDSILAPTASPRRNVHVAQGSQITAVVIDPLQLSIGKKSNGVAIGRPEWMCCPFGSG